MLRALLGAFGVLVLVMGGAAGCGPAPSRDDDRDQGAPKTKVGPSPSDGAAPARAEPGSPAPKASRRRIDAHVHLLPGQVQALLESLDRAGIERAVVLASPHLDPSAAGGSSVARFSGWRGANDALLRETLDHRDRLVPFVTLAPADFEAEALDGWLAEGACGVKLYAGHRSFHARALADEAHETLWTALEERALPVLLHVNSFRYEAEIGTLLAKHPDLSLVCPHLCGSRTDLDRLDRLLAAHPRLLVDTSHGPGRPGIDGFLNLEGERERLRATIRSQPERFLFGSDLVTLEAPGPEDAARVLWDRQLAANLGLLEHARFEFDRPVGEHGGLLPGTYAGLALPDPALEQVLATNAERWLARCSP